MRHEDRPERIPSQKAWKLIRGSAMAIGQSPLNGSGVAAPYAEWGSAVASERRNGFPPKPGDQRIAAGQSSELCHFLFVYRFSTGCLLKSPPVFC